jgi:hypothetical protein
MKSARIVQEHKTHYSKGDVRYWLQPKRLRQDLSKSPYYTVQIAFKGSRHSYPTSTSNKNAAAKIASQIYNDLVALGVDATLAKYRPKKTTTTITNTTVDQWINAAVEISRARDGSLNGYAGALRRIAAGIQDLHFSRKKFGPKKGGSSNFRSKTGSSPLTIFTLDAVHKWMKTFVAKAQTNTKKASAMTTCNSTIRQARSLFADKITRSLTHIPLPSPLPFEGVEFFPSQSSKYRSKINLEKLMQDSKEELQQEHPQVFLAFVLAVTMGLRRSEIDALHWNQVDLDNRRIWIELTDDAIPKTDDSRASVQFDEKLAQLLKPIKQAAKGRFVLESTVTKAGSKKWGQHYRADHIFNNLIAWLRKHGVTARKPIHELRKELGAQYATKHGIYVASRILRHANTAITDAVYSDLKETPVIAFGQMFERTEDPKSKKVT